MKVRLTIMRAVLFAAAPVICLALVACSKSSSTTEPSGAYVLQIAGGLVNASGNATIKQFQVFLDNDTQPIQTTTYGSPTNVAEINLGLSVVRVSQGMHSLWLKPSQQTVTSASYSSYAIVIMVFNSSGGIVYQSTPPDKPMGQMTTSDRIEVPFGRIP
jgi:hypothetical protein